MAEMFEIRDTGELAAYSGPGGEVCIPDGVTRIGGFVFSARADITAVHLPDGVLSIGRSAFVGCKSLEKINFPEGLSMIDQLAFAKCVKLGDIDFPASLHDIGPGVFKDCSSLTRIVAHPGVKALGYMTFAGCTALESVSLPDTLRQLGVHVFDGCSRLSDLELPVSVSKLGDSAFAGCERITHIRIPAGMREIGPNVFAQCRSLDSFTVDERNDRYSSPDGRCLLYGDRLIAYAQGSGDSYRIPDGVAVVDASSFENCATLVSIEVPASVTLIGPKAFAGCAMLQEVKLAEGVAMVAAEAFAGCSALRLISCCNLPAFPGGLLEAGSPPVFAPFSRWDGAKSPLAQVKLVAGYVVATVDGLVGADEAQAGVWAGCTEDPAFRAFVEENILKLCAAVGYDARCIEWLANEGFLTSETVRTLLDKAAGSLGTEATALLMEQAKSTASAASAETGLEL